MLIPRDMSDHVTCRSRDFHQAQLVETESGIHKIDTGDLLSVDIEPVKQVGYCRSFRTFIISYMF